MRSGASSVPVSVRASAFASFGMRQIARGDRSLRPGNDRSGSGATPDRSNWIKLRLQSPESRSYFIRLRRSKWPASLTEEVRQLGARLGLMHRLKPTPLPYCWTKASPAPRPVDDRTEPLSNVRERWGSFAPARSVVKRPPAKGGLWLRYPIYSCRPSTANERNFAYFSPTLRSSTYSGLARQARIFSILSQT